MHALGHDVYVYDVNRVEDPPDYVKVVEKAYGDPDLTFICVPETAVEEIVERLVEEDKTTSSLLRARFRRQPPRS